MMNNIFLGGSNSYDDEMQRMKQLNEELARRKQELSSHTHTERQSEWDKIDSLADSMTEAEKQMMSECKDFVESDNKINMLMQSAYMSLVKPIIEQSEEGREALRKHYNIMKESLSKVRKKRDEDMDALRRWATEHPDKSFNEFRMSEGNINNNNH